MNVPHGLSVCDWITLRVPLFTERWDVGPGERAEFPTKWIDGKTAWLVFSGDDHFSVRRAIFDVAD